MSKCCCKYAKWFPHNWLCLKGLAILFLVLFYISVIYALYVIEEIIRKESAEGEQDRTAPDE